MKIALDISPIKGKVSLQHRVRGTGFYTKNLKQSLEKYFPQNLYTFFTRGDKIAKNTDVVHYPYFEPFFLTLPIIKKYKTVVTVHDFTPLVFPKDFPAGLKGNLKWRFQKSSLKNADAVIADSQCSKKDIIRFTGILSEKIHVVYLAVSEEFKKLNLTKEQIMQTKKKYNLPEKFLLYVGDATWNKNLPRLLKAVEQVAVPLVMVGKALIEKNIDSSNFWNKDLIEVQQLAKKNKNVIRLGFIPTEDLVFIYNIATVFVMPSLYEGFGLPILEAMTCGCFVVTSKTGSIPEIAGEACRYVDAYSIEAIAQGIKDAFNNQNLRENFSEKAIAQSKKFKWSKTALETMNIYKSVVNK